MKPLADILGELPKDSVALVSRERTLTRAALLGAASKIRNAISASGAAINIVDGSDPLDAIVRIVALDGHVPAFYLVPKESSELLLKCMEPCPPALPRGDDGTCWIMPTSGTTGTPKWIVHTLSSLTKNTKRDAIVGAALRWGLLYDPCRFAGLQVVLQALIGGSTLLVPPLHDLVESIDFLIQERCTSLSATPSMWRKLSGIQGFGRLALRHVTLGGEIADRKILTFLAKCFPAASVVHVYASTEAGVGFSVRDGMPGFPKWDPLESTCRHASLSIL